MKTETIDNLRCEICGHTRFEGLYALNDGLRIIKCGGCGLWMSYPPLSGGEADRIYGDYHEKWGVVGEDEDAHREMRSATFDILLKKINRIKNPKDSALLDVGCSTGICMEVAERYGWNAEGIDISARAVSIARKRFGPRASVLNLEESSSLPAGRYDLIIMTDVLEHLRHVKNAMDKINGMIKPGGAAAIVTVDTGSLFARLMGKRWVHLCRAHTFYFSKSNLSMLLKSAGFNKLRFEKSLKSVNLWYVQKFMRQTLGASKRPAKLFLFADFIIERLPDAVKRLNFVIPTGDITVIAEKG